MIVLNKMEYSDDVNLSTVATEIEIPKLQFVYIAAIILGERQKRPVTPKQIRF